MSSLRLVSSADLAVEAPAASPGLPLDFFDRSQAEVKARFAWAVRQGNPNWLWPAVIIAGWQDALLQIEDVTRQILLDGRASRVLAGSVENFCVAAFTSGMGPLLGWWAAQGVLLAPPGIRAVLDLHYRHNLLRMERLGVETARAVDALAGAGVGAVVLKGMQTAFAYFPSPACRPLADVDLLIDPADKERAGAVLAGLGYLAGRTRPLPPQQCWRKPESSPLPRSLMLTHREDPWYIDLQTGLSRRYSAGAAMMELEALAAPDWLEPAAVSPAARAFRPPALAFHLACHAGCGLENLTMVRIVELALIIRGGRLGTRFAWDEFLAAGEETGALASTFATLYLAEALCPGSVPYHVLETAERQAPPAVSKTVRRLRPCSAQSVLRCTLEERFMWTDTISRLVRQILRELAPRGIPLSELAWIYWMRGWRLVRGTLKGHASDAF